MEKQLRKLLAEQHFKGRKVCLFSSDPEVKEMLATRMAAEISEGSWTGCDAAIFWLWPGAETKKTIQDAFKRLGGKGKLVFLLDGREHGKLKELLWEVGFMITQHSAFSIVPTAAAGASYRKSGSARELLFIVAEKMNF